MNMDNQEDDTVGALRTGMVDTHTHIKKRKEHNHIKTTTKNKSHVAKFD